VIDPCTSDSPDCWREGTSPSHDPSCTARGNLVKTESGVRARSDNPRSRGPAPDFRRAQLPPRKKRRPRPARHGQHFMDPRWTQSMQTFVPHPRCRPRAEPPCRKSAALKTRWGRDHRSQRFQCRGCGIFFPDGNYHTLRALPDAGISHTRARPKATPTSLMSGERCAERPVAATSSAQR